MTIKKDQILSSVLQFAESNSLIRAVYIEGSRVNPTVAPDELQDYDIVFVVSDFDAFIKDSNWTDLFGAKLIEQQPETFSFGEKQDNFFSYLIQYKDGFRIDFSIIPVEKRHQFKDSLRVILLDKDGLYPETPPSSDKDYWVKPPTEKWFQEVCNEFWWVSTYVAKGLFRNEIPYAIKHFEEILRPMLMQMIDWKIGYEKDFKVSTGKSGKFYPKYLGEKLYAKFLETYSDSKKENIWKAMFLMADLFSTIAKDVSAKMNFTYNIQEENNILNYLKEMQQKTK